LAADAANQLGEEMNLHTTSDARTTQGTFPSPSRPEPSVTGLEGNAGQIAKATVREEDADE
jgi:hypothetical protein